MTFYSGLQNTANQLLQKFGQTGVYSRDNVGGTYNRQEGSVTGGATESTTVNVVITPFDKREIDGTLIQAKDLQALSGQGFEPTTDYKLTVNGQSYEVISVEQVNPAGTPVLYKAQVRA